MPEFETDDDHTYFISRFYVHEEFAKKAEDSESVNAENGSVKPENESVNETVSKENDTVNPKSETVNRKNDTVNLCIKNMQERLAEQIRISEKIDNVIYVIEG